MAHGLKTSYKDFINWYWEKRLNALVVEQSPISEDCLCKLEIKNTKDCASWSNFFFFNSYRDLITREWKYPPYEIVSAIKDNTDDFSVTYSRFFETILQSIETRGWVDIENDYYQLLKGCSENADCGYTVKELNEQLAYLQEKLVEYLSSIGTNHHIKELHDAMIEFFDPADFSTEGRKKALENMGLENTNLEDIQYNFEGQINKNANFVLNLFNIICKLSSSKESIHLSLSFLNSFLTLKIQEENSTVTTI